MLDVPTLLTVTAFVTILLGLFLATACIRERGIPALAWWGVAYVIGGVAITLWSLQTHPRVSLPELPQVLLFLACGLIWTGARQFQGKPPSHVGIGIGGFMWLMAMQWPELSESVFMRVLLAAALVATYAVATANALRGDRRRDGMGRKLAAASPLLHGAVFVSPVMLVMIASPNMLADGWFVLIALQTLLYVVGSAFVVVVTAKERIALFHKTAAMTDPLTGLFNRRAFFETANAMIATRARARAPVTVLAFDLDHFKSINDRFGHAAGDAALRTFAATAANTLRATDVVGRIGGEEFVAILPCTLPEAAIAAERVRKAYQAAGQTIDDHPMNSTVSIGAAGLALPLGVGCEIESMLAAADAALYRAKENGRNRIELAQGSAAPDPEADPAARPSKAATLPPVGMPVAAAG